MFVSIAIRELVVLSRKTGAGAVKHPVLVAPGLRPDGCKEVIDYRLTTSERAAEWEKFLTGLPPDTI